MLAGGTALVSHGVKAGARLAANTSPEPFSNIGLSLGEDLTVLTVMIFAVQHPEAAAVIAAVLLVLGGVAVLAVLRLVRSGWQRWQARRRPPGALRGPT